MFYEIIRNNKTATGEIEGYYFCDFNFSHKREQRSLDLVSINGNIICKSCLSYLIGEVDKSILERSKNVI